MHDGKEDPVASDRLQDIFTAFEGYSPQTTAQVGFYNSAVTQLNASDSNDVPGSRRSTRRSRARLRHCSFCRRWSAF